MSWSVKNSNGNFIHATAQIHPKATLGKNVHIGPGAIIHECVDLADGVYIWDNSVIGRAPQRPGSEPIRDGRRTSIGRDSVIGTNCTIYAGTFIHNNVLIGDGVRIRENCKIWAGCIIGSNCTFQNEVTMYAESRVIDLSHITAGVVIGAGAFVSTGVLTMNDDSFAGNNATGEKRLNPPSIGSHASIGGGATLLPGVNIGEDAVVAAGSIVTKNVEPGTLVMGVAAKRRYLSPTDEGLKNPVVDLLLQLQSTGYRPHDGDALTPTKRSYEQEDV